MSPVVLLERFLVPSLLLLVGAGCAYGTYRLSGLLWDPVMRYIDRLRKTDRDLKRRQAAVLGRSKPDPIEVMAAAAGYPLGWHGPQWQAAMILGAMLIAAGAFLLDALNGLIWAALWPAVVMAGLRRWRMIYETQRKVEAEDFAVGMEVLIQGENIPRALQELADTCPTIAPALERCWTTWGTEGSITALINLAREVPELEAVVAALQQGEATSYQNAAAALKQEALRMQHLREAAVQASMEVQSQLFKFTIIPPGITLIRVVFGAIWHFAAAQFLQG